MTISRPTNEWPLLICGPMLRRVTPRSVSVFVATRDACTVELTLYTGDSATAAAQLHSQSADTMKLGTRLHVCVVSLVLPSPMRDLASGTTYGYDIRLRAGPGTSQSLAELGLLSGTYPLGYVNGKLPTFALPPGRADLRLIYGSCRKPHAEGRDGLAILDIEIGKIVGSGSLSPDERARRRPHQLFLVGDQIYADDVSVCFLKTLMATAEQLLGWTEDIPSSSGTVRPNSPAVQPGPARGNLLRDQKTSRGKPVLTTEHHDAHLLFLGEFYAMYLMVWSDALWPRSGTKMSLATPEELVPKEERRGEWFEQAKSDRTQVIFFANDIARVRRALANVPTYMMLDDHEVTDDWNLHGQWSLNARRDDLVRRILRNGLLAYAVFQDWGNRAERYVEGPGQKLFDSILVPMLVSEPLINARPAFVDETLDIGPIETLPTEAEVAEGAPLRIHWSYVVIAPEHQVVMLDIRTWRGFPGPTKNAALVSQLSLSEQLDAYRTPIGGRLTLVVSGAPVFGHPIWEEGIQKFLVAIDKANGPETYDNEPWGGNRPAFEDLIARLARFQRVIILSGDVHYAFSNHVGYFPDSSSDPTPARILQLCGSSFKNEDSWTRRLDVRGYFGVRQQGWMGFAEDLSVLYGDLTDYAQKHIGQSYSKRAATLCLDFVINDRLSRPAVIPDGPWITDEALRSVYEMGPPDWLYSITYVYDERTDDQRILDVPEVAAALTGASSDDRATVGGRSRAVVGYNNLSQLTFRTSAGAESVVHRIHWWAPEVVPALQGAVMATEHVLPLSVPAASEKPVPRLWTTP